MLLIFLKNILTSPLYPDYKFNYFYRIYCLFFDYIWIIFVNIGSGSKFSSYHPHPLPWVRKAFLFIAQFIHSLIRVLLLIHFIFMKILRNLLFFSLLLGSLSFFAGCGHQQERNTMKFTNSEGLVWNTQFHLTYNGPESITDSARSLLADLGHTLSVFDTALNWWEVNPSRRNGFKRISRVQMSARDFQWV